MGLEEALITAATNDALEQGYMTVFVSAPPPEMARLYHRLGFTRMASKLTYTLEPEPENDDSATLAES